MARPILTLDDLHRYIRTLQANSLHHANGMLEVFPNVLTAAIGRMDPGTLHVRERLGDTKNAAWCEINGRRYFFSYCHDDAGSVTVKEGTMQGPVVERFVTGDTFSDISRRLADLATAIVP
jgi:hypothetical protein